MMLKLVNVQNIFKFYPFHNSYLQCLRKEVEEEVYKSLVNKRLAAGEVTLRLD